MGNQTRHVKGVFAGKSRLWPCQEHPMQAAHRRRKRLANALPIPAHSLRPYRSGAPTASLVMRCLLAALTVAAVLYGNVSAQAEKRIFIIANNSDGYGVDRCLASGASCGKTVATAYCQAR